MIQVVKSKKLGNATFLSSVVQATPTIAFSITYFMAAWKNLPANIHDQTRLWAAIAIGLGLGYATYFVLAFITKRSRKRSLANSQPTLTQQSPWSRVKSWLYDNVGTLMLAVLMGEYVYTVAISQHIPTIPTVILSVVGGLEISLTMHVIASKVLDEMMRILRGEFLQEPEHGSARERLAWEATEAIRQDKFTTGDLFLWGFLNLVPAISATVAIAALTCAFEVMIRVANDVATKTHQDELGFGFGIRFVGFILLGFMQIFKTPLSAFFERIARRCERASSTTEGMRPTTERADCALAWATTSLRFALLAIAVGWMVMPPYAFG